jgi:hypothetical protein
VLPSAKFSAARSAFRHLLTSQVRSPSGAQTMRKDKATGVKRLFLKELRTKPQLSQNESVTASSVTAFF